MIDGDVGRETANNGFWTVCEVFGQGNAVYFRVSCNVQSIDRALSRDVNHDELSATGSGRITEQQCVAIFLFYHGCLLIRSGLSLRAAGDCTAKEEQKKKQRQEKKQVKDPGYFAQKKNLLVGKMPGGGFCYALAYHLNPGIAQGKVNWSTVAKGIAGSAITFLPTDFILIP